MLETDKPRLQAVPPTWDVLPRAGSFSVGNPDGPPQQGDVGRASRGPAGGELRDATGRALSEVPGTQRVPDARRLTTVTRAVWVSAP